jgi:hypothetical protein
MIGVSTVRGILCYDTLGYEFQEGDIVMFQVYLDVEEVKDETKPAYVQLRMHGGEVNNYGHVFYPDRWTTVVMSPEAFDRTFASGSDYSTETDGRRFWIHPSQNMNAKLYLSRAEVIPASEVKDITTSDFTLGTTEFVGSGENATGLSSASTPNDKIYNHVSNRVPYYFNGQIRFYIRNYKGATPNPCVTLAFKTAQVLSAGRTVEVTLRGALVEQIQIQLGNGALITSSSATPVADGYTKYTFTVPSPVYANIIRIFPAGQEFAQEQYRQIDLLNVEVK